MTTLNRQTFTDVQRMELRSYVQLAGEVIAQYWPMRTFIYHNPLHGLEGLHFDEAVKRGTQLFGGRGYLSNEVFRNYFKSGRICQEDCGLHSKPSPPIKRSPLPVDLCHISMCSWFR